MEKEIIEASDLRFRQKVEELRAQLERRQQSYAHKKKTARYLTFMVPGFFVVVIVAGYYLWGQRMLRAPAREPMVSAKSSVSLPSQASSSTQPRTPQPRIPTPEPAAAVKPSDSVMPPAAAVPEEPRSVEPAASSLALGSPSTATALEEPHAVETPVAVEVAPAIPSEGPSAAASATVTPPSVARPIPSSRPTLDPAGAEPAAVMASAEPRVVEEPVPAAAEVAPASPTVEPSATVAAPVPPPAVTSPVPRDIPTPPVSSPESSALPTTDTDAPVGARAEPTPPPPVSPLADFRITASQSCVDVVARECVGAQEVFALHEHNVPHVWMTVYSQNLPYVLKHVYYHEGERYAEVPLAITYPRMRTWSNVTLRSPTHVGAWRVEIVTEDGTIVQQVTFRVTP